ncbi:olfactory receptor 52M1-like [Gorilla gorilla gorilla]|uniref:olfactory receptor 52M1-like n=1 Tax=Gorilla gorilla gorilla TaxID=9595 RepID=UPI00300B6172
MLTPDNACSVPTSFWLTGIPGLESLHIWLSIPFGSMYLVAVLGNITILAVVRMEHSLHQPMYFFLCMLAVIDLVLSTSTMPKLLAIFWFGAHNIGVNACLAQMFFIHCFATVESGIFLAVAFDHYVAICDSLHHTLLLTHAVVGRLGLAALLRGVIYIGPLPLMIRLRLPLYHTQIIAHSYCEHMAVVTLACGDTRVNNLYGMGIGFLVLILDSLAITASYVTIFRAVMGLATSEARLKTLGTCGSHICAILVFYIPIAVSSLTHRFGHRVPPHIHIHIHILLASIYLLIPPVLNPIVYAVRTKQIRETLLHIEARTQTRFLRIVVNKLGGKLEHSEYPGDTRGQASTKYSTYLNFIKTLLYYLNPVPVQPCCRALNLFCLFGLALLKSQAPLKPGSVSENQVPLKPGSVSENQVPLKPGSLSENQVPLKPGSLSENQVPLKPGSLSENQVPLKPGSLSENQVPLKPGSLSENQVPLKPGSLLENQVPLKPGSLLENRVPLKKPQAPL